MAMLLKAVLDSNLNQFGFIIEMLVPTFLFQNEILAITKSRLGMMASYIMELDAITIEVV